MNTEFYTHNEYFASANGYGGFKSYFDKIFASRDFERIFVLKGGPGTGKSSFIKKIAALSYENGLGHELFRCSSDPNSLDGIIIEEKGKRVAVLDGTAPHERDAEVPGAVDTIINLGAAWKQDALKSKRDSVLKLIERKNGHYKRAYEYLKYSSVFATNIKAEISNHMDKNECTKKCNELADIFYDGTHGKVKTRLVSSFSKFGYKTLTDTLNTFDKSFSVFGRYGSDALFIGLMRMRLEELGAEICKIPSPLDPGSDEGIILPNKNTLLFGMGSGKIICDTLEFLKIKNLRDFENLMQRLENGKEYYLNLAAEELSLASDAHFELESIYTPLMDFSVVEEFFSSAAEEIKNIYRHDV